MTVWIAAWILLICLILKATVDPIRAWVHTRDPIGMSRKLINDDRIDAPLILHALASKPTFASTFAWWHSSWVPEVPFWRPLTIQTFWIEDHVFTTERFDRWVLVSCIAHVISIAAFGWLVFLLTAGWTRWRRLAVLWVALAVYAAARVTDTPAFLSDLFVMVPADVAIGLWKNQPDLFADIFVFSSLALVLRRRYFRAIACAFIAVAFKESGWMAWVLAGAILTLRREWRRVPTRAYAVAALSILVLLVGYFLCVLPRLHRVSFRLM